jgi:membrane-associated phospholipid phosphatase
MPRRASTRPAASGRRHTWFKAKGTWLNRGSFPSGHTAGAFAVATVFSRRYGRSHRWVPWLSYSLATVTGFSRVSWSAHFPSDVFLGATLAYVIGRYVVLRNAEEPTGEESSAILAR